MKKFNRTHILLGLVILLPHLLQAAQHPAAHDDIATGLKHLTHDWDRWQSLMAERGVTIEAAYTADVFSIVHGGLRHGQVYLDNIDLMLTLDGQSLFGWTGFTAYVHALDNNGGSPSGYAGDAQVLSNIDAPDAATIFEAWCQQEFLAGRLSLRLGLYDVNSEFDVLDSAQLFLNSSHGIGPGFSQAGENGPSIFPVTSVGLRINYNFGPSTYIRGVILDGVPGDPDRPHGPHIIFHRQDGVLCIAETGRLLGRNHDIDTEDGKIAVGAWYFSAATNHNTLNEKDLNLIHGRENMGVYVIAEKALFHESHHRDQGLWAFLRFDMANERLNRFDHYLGGGLVYQGLIPERPDDILGVAVARAHNGYYFTRMQQQVGSCPDPAETALELTWQLQLRPGISVTPDLQVIIHPNTDPSVANALVIGMRFNLEM